MNSRQKGKVGELEFAELLRSYGYQARRGQQFSGGKDSPDVVCEELPVHWEVKRQQKLNVNKAMHKLCSEAAPGKWRMIAHRINGSRHQPEPWLVTLPFEDLMDLIKEWKSKIN